MARKAMTSADIFQKYHADPDIGRKSRGWFMKKQQELTKARLQPQRVIRQGENLQSRILPGRLYLFAYDAKLKETLPYWDRYPLVFPYEKTSDGFMGLNMHYLPYILRVRLLDALLLTANNRKLDATTRMKFQYSTVKASSKLRLAQPCLKRYLASHVQSRFLEIPASEWHTAMMLPVERFVGANKQSVWSDSFSMV